MLGFGLLDRKCLAQLRKKMSCILSWENTEKPTIEAKLGKWEVLTANNFSFARRPVQYFGSDNNIRSVNVTHQFIVSYMWICIFSTI
jgi:hypothetical protein